MKRMIDLNQFLRAEWREDMGEWHILGWYMYVQPVEYVLTYFSSLTELL